VALRRAGVDLSPPKPYVEFLATCAAARAVVTDSGGLQVDACVLGVPCVTLRDVTEHPSTLTCGVNRLAGSEPKGLRRAVRDALRSTPSPVAARGLWDGRAGQRIARDLARPGVGARSLTK
jgi:UDP-N-acetylglucosamine 2-epimerase (non-hydrolysing)